METVNCGLVLPDLSIISRMILSYTPRDVMKVTLCLYSLLLQGLCAGGFATDTAGEGELLKFDVAVPSGV